MEKAEDNLKQSRRVDRIGRVNESAAEREKRREEKEKEEVSDSHDVDHRHQHAVLVGVASIFDDGCRCLESAESRQEIEYSDGRITLVRFLAMLMRSRPDRWENSTA